MNKYNQLAQPWDKEENKRCRIDVLEEDIERGINAIEKIKQNDPDIVGLYNDYFLWCISMLKINRNRLSTKQNREIKYKIKVYKRRILELALKYNISSGPNYSNQLIIGYAEFLQSGLKLYNEKVDAFNFIINMDEVFHLTYNKAPSVASYAFIALLARFTLEKNSLLYLQLYPTVLGKIKQALPQAYANPSDDNIFGLLFLTFISLSHFNTTACVRYFSLAIRMAQSLGCDRMAEESDELSIVEGEERLTIERGKKIWKSISSSYSILITLIPNFPLFRVKLIPSSFTLITLDFPEQSNESTHKSNCYKPSSNPSSALDNLLYGRIITVKSLNQILVHIQDVKLKMANKTKLELIPPNEFRLPLDKFNNTAFHLVRGVEYKMPGLDIYYELKYKNKIENLVKHLNRLKENFFVYQWNGFRQSIIIALYYPSVFAFPQAVKFPLNEAIILFKAAQLVTDYYFNIDYIKKNKPQLLPHVYISSIANNEGFGRTYYSPYYTYLMHALFVYLCFVCESEWLFSQGFTKDKMSYCEDQVLNITSFLKNATRSSVNNERKDSFKTLEYIKSTLKNYTIPQPFYSILISIFLQP